MVLFFHSVEACVHFVESCSNVVNGFLESSLEEAFGNETWEAVSWARDLDVLSGAFSPFNVLFLWVPVSESEFTVAVLHLLGDERNVIAHDHLPLDSDITKVSFIGVATFMLGKLRVNVSIIQLWSSPSCISEGSLDGTGDRVEISFDWHIFVAVKLTNLGVGNFVGAESYVVVDDGLILKWPADWVLTVLLNFESGRVLFGAAPFLCINLSCLGLISRLV